MICDQRNALEEMVFNHSAQYGEFPAVIVIDHATSFRLKQEHYELVGGELFDIAHVLNGEFHPSTFMGVPVEVIE